MIDVFICEFRSICYDPIDIIEYLFAKFDIEQSKLQQLLSIAIDIKYVNTAKLLLSKSAVMTESDMILAEKYNMDI